MKTLFGLSWLAQKKWQIFPNDSAAFRFPGMLTAGLLLWLVYIFGARAVSRPAGAFAAMALALMPRFFYHSHLDCFDVPIVFFLTLVTYTYWRSLDRPLRWVAAVGVTYGLALATKHNAWILPGVLFIHFVWVGFGGRAARSNPSRPRGVSLFPWWLIAMALFGVPLFVGTWPWLWYDGVERWLWYANFHMQHVHYPIAYFGHTYAGPPFPMSYPWVMTAITMSATVIVLAAYGVGLHLRAIAPEWSLPRTWNLRLTQDPPDRRFTMVLWVGCLLAPMVVIALPHTPIFGGTKHWMPAYPFLALFAGVGFEQVIERAYRAFRALERLSLSWLHRPAARYAAGGLLLLLPSGIETVHSHPFGLSHYGFLVGHVPGAADRGMNRQFWGFTHGPLADWLIEALPEGGTVWPGDATHFSWRMWQRDGRIPDSIRPVARLDQADLILVHHEDHFADVEGQIWTVIGRADPVHVLSYDGVPLVSIYENPRRRRAR